MSFRLRCRFNAAAAPIGEFAARTFRREDEVERSSFDLRRRQREGANGNSPRLLSECRPIRPHLIDYKIDGGSDAGDALEVRVRNHPVSSVKSHGWQHNS
jgi:hypothetical protein